MSGTTTAKGPSEEQISAYDYFRRRCHTIPGGGGCPSFVITDKDKVDLTPPERTGLWGKVISLFSGFSL